MRAAVHILMAVLVAVSAAGAGCVPLLDDDRAPTAFSDRFDRDELGAPWRFTGGTWRIVDGQLCTLGDHNLPLWLDVPLSQNARISFTAVSKSTAVDMKAEVWGDGVRHESGYIAILGGWNNTLTVLARLDEHEPTRKVKKRGYERLRPARFVIERTDGKTVRFKVNDEEVLAYVDPAPLFGARNHFLGFTSWESEVCYDDFVIEPLPG